MHVKGEIPLQDALEGRIERTKYRTSSRQEDKERMWCQWCEPQGMDGSPGRWRLQRAVFGGWAQGVGSKAVGSTQVR